MTKNITNNDNHILNELINIQIRNEYYTEIKLYRGTEKNHGDFYIFPINRLTSWSRDIEIAKRFGRYVYECTFENNDILIDTMLINIGIAHTFKEEDEIIIHQSRKVISHIINV